MCVCVCACVYPARWCTNVGRAKRARLKRKHELHQQAIREHRQSMRLAAQGIGGHGMAGNDGQATTPTIVRHMPMGASFVIGGGPPTSSSTGSPNRLSLRKSPLLCMSSLVTSPTSRSPVGSHLGPTGLRKPVLGEGHQKLPPPSRPKRTARPRTAPLHHARTAVSAPPTDPPPPSAVAVVAAAAPKDTPCMEPIAIPRGTLWTTERAERRKQFNLVSNRLDSRVRFFEQFL